MPQQPSAISLMLCDQVVFEHGTQKPYLLGIFTGVAAEAFPTVPQKFDVFVALTDGLGEVTIHLSVTHLESNQEIFTQKMKVEFPDPLRIINLRFRFRQLVYEQAGTYVFAVLIGDQEIAARRVRVYDVED
ncbi:MAG TPA: hypothetical protein VNX28_06690 [Gemmataceae bacterium]|jgi:hypothetical protein|nr:hypothetical protein [Gemmataceae bacterium]